MNHAAVKPDIKKTKATKRPVLFLTVPEASGRVFLIGCFLSSSISL
jgi:hypothetical protein